MQRVFSIHKTLILLLIWTALLAGMSGCLIVVEDSGETKTRTIAMSPKPALPMSDEIIRSGLGDMIAFIPKDWFFLDVKNKVPSNVFAVAVNADYTLSVVFSTIRKDSDLDQLFAKEELIGLARASFQRRERKTAGTIKRLGAFDVVTVGVKQFGVYTYSNDNGATSTRVAVFKSSLDNYYEFTLVQLPFTGRKIPPAKDVETVYSSVLATIDY